MLECATPFKQYQERASNCLDQAMLEQLHAIWRTPARIITVTRSGPRSSCLFDGSLLWMQGPLFWVTDDLRVEVLCVVSTS